MNDPMTILRKDHAEATELLTKLSRSQPGYARNALVTKVTTALELHMDIEETLVYPLIEKLEGADTRREAEVEHKLAREGLATMNRMIDELGFGAAAESLLGGIVHHVREEEAEVLPTLRGRLSDKEWANLGEQIASAHAAGTVPARR